MTAWPWLAAVAALAAGGALVLLAPAPRRYPRAVRATAGTPAPGAVGTPAPRAADGRGWRRPWLLALLAGAGGVVLLPGVPGWLAGLGLAVWVRRTTAGLATAGARGRAAVARAQLPALVELVSGGLAAGAPVERAVAVACAAWPGPAADRLSPVTARLTLGSDPVSVWSSVADDAVLAPLGRALARAASSGAPVADVVARLAADLDDRGRAEAEDRARAVGVRAAVPLGLCLLPAFVLLGIVPLVAGLLRSLG